MPPADMPNKIATLAHAKALERLARRVETPCGAGAMVWHVWGEGPPVVLIHGGSGSWSHWVRSIGPLAASGRSVYVPDLPGCGDSAPPPQGHDGDALPPWIDRGVRALLGATPFDLVGFSFGAMVSGFFAADYPAQVRRLILVGAPALSSAPMAKVALREWLPLPDGPEREAAMLFNLRALMLARDESVDELALTLYADALKRDRLTKRRMAATDVLLRTMPRIACPVWGIWGAEDVLYHDRFDVVTQGIARAPDFRSLAMIPRAGHWVQFEDADAFNPLLLAMLDE